MSIVRLVNITVLLISSLAAPGLLAAPVTSFTLQDGSSVFPPFVGLPPNVQDGIAAAISIDSPLNLSDLAGSFCTASSGSTIAAGSTGGFATGQCGGNPGVLELFTYGNGLDADISNNSLTINTFDLGYNVVPGTVLMPFDSSSFAVIDMLPVAENTYYVSFIWSRFYLDDPLDSGSSVTYHVYLEGVMTTSPVPVPASAWLFASALLVFINKKRHP